MSDGTPAPRRAPDEEADLETARLLIHELEMALAEQLAITTDLLLRIGQYEQRVALCEQRVRDVVAKAAALSKPPKVVELVFEDDSRRGYVPAG